MGFTRERKGKERKGKERKVKARFKNTIQCNKAQKTITSHRKQALRASKTPSKLSHKGRRKIQDRARKKQKINKT